MTSAKVRIQGFLASFTQRLPLFRKILAVVWVLSVGVQIFTTEDSPAWLLLPLIAVAVAYIVWPKLFRPILVSTVVLFLSGLVVFAHIYFRTILMVPVIIFNGLGIAGIILSYYGRGPATFLLGLGLSLASALVFPENPLFTSPRSELECRTQMDAIEQRLTPYLSQWSESPRTVRLPEKPGWPLVHPRYLLEVGPQGKWFGAPLPDDRERAASELRAVFTRLHGTPPPIFLAADIDQPVSDLSVLLRDLPLVDIWVLATKKPGPLGPPPPGAQAFANALASAHEDGEGAQILSLELSRRVGVCETAAQQVDLIGEIPIEDRARFLVEEVSDGLRDCQCSYVDLDAFEYLIKIYLGVPAHEYSAKQIPRDSSGALMIPDDSELLFGEWVASL